MATLADCPNEKLPFWTEAIWYLCKVCKRCFQFPDQLISHKRQWKHIIRKKIRRQKSTSMPQNVIPSAINIGPGEESQVTKTIVSRNENRKQALPLSELDDKTTEICESFQEIKNFDALLDEPNILAGTNLKEEVKISNSLWPENVLFLPAVEDEITVKINDLKDTMWSESSTTVEDDVNNDKNLKSDGEGSHNDMSSSSIKGLNALDVNKVSVRSKLLAYSNIQEERNLTLRSQSIKFSGLLEEDVNVEKGIENSQNGLSSSDTSESLKEKVVKKRLRRSTKLFSSPQAETNDNGTKRMLRSHSTHHDSIKIDKKKHNKETGPGPTRIAAKSKITAKKFSRKKNSLMPKIIKISANKEIRVHFRRTRQSMSKIRSCTLKPVTYKTTRNYKNDQRTLRHRHQINQL